MRSKVRVVALAALAAAASGAVLAWSVWRGTALRRAHPRAAHSVAALSNAAWPGPEAVLRAPAALFPPGFGVRRVVVDPGHGAPGNRGNTSCFCVDEQDFTLVAAAALRERLEATGHFEVQLSRELGALVDYADRIDDAAAWGAEAFVSLHSDVRGKSDRWSPEPSRTCPINQIAPGFSVLYSDEADPPLAEARRALARATARRMREAGLLAYGGGAYGSEYEPEASAPGVFLDRHPREQRIFVLRRAPMPSIIVETHHALDPREVERWSEAATFDAFGAAVAAALADVLGRGNEATARLPGP